MQRWKLTLEYDGTPFSGWQIQDGAQSVQQLLEHAIARFSTQKAATIVAGRTDAGVHALGQVVHFDLEKPFDAFNVRNGINFYLRPQPISVLKAEPVDQDFNARLSAVKRHYRYRIINRHPDLALELNRAWRIVKPLDVELMRQAALHLIGRHDFSSFRATACQSSLPVRTLDDITINRAGDEVNFDINAKSFLHHQVRNIVGTLTEVGRGKRQAADIKTILDAKDRRVAGVMAPACGLYFMRVDYN